MTKAGSRRFAPDMDFRPTCEELEARWDDLNDALFDDSRSVSDTERAELVSR
jgi:hypothetical protein